MSNTINICYVINEKFHDMTLYSVNQIKKFFKCKTTQLKFYIITYDKITSDQAEYVYMEREMPICHIRPRIPDILNVDKCIFLDSDTICMKCISMLWNLDLQGKSTGVVQHHMFKNVGDMFDLYRLQLDGDISNAPCFNCGVMVFDCIKWKQLDLTQLCVSQFEKYKNTVHYRRDEPGLNVVLRNHVTFIDERWNYCPRHNSKLVPYILHYYGNFKSVEACHNEFSSLKLN